jgi:hypothetical protein
VIDRKVTRRKVLPWIGGAGAAAFLTRAEATVGQPREGQRAGTAPGKARDPGGVWFAEVGGVMDGSQQGAKLQAWLCEAATQGEVALLPPGSVASDRELIVPENVRIVGSGIGQSFIQYPSDLGSGKFALKPATGDAPLYLAHLSLEGPGRHPVRGGQPIAAMDGLSLPGRCFVEHVRATRFRSSALLAGDHHRLYDFNGGGSEYGLVWDNDASAGDEYVVACDLVTCSKASIGVTTRGAINNALFVATHLGNAPFGIHRFAVPGEQRETFMDGVEFQYCGIEDCAQAVIFDEPGNASIQQVVFDNGGGAGTFEGGLAWPGKPSRAFIDIGKEVRDLYWTVGEITPRFGRPLVRAPYITNVDIDRAEEALQEMEADQDLRLVESSEIVVGVRLGTHALRAVARRAAERVTRGDLCEATADDGVRRWRGGRPVGIAVHPATNGQMLTLLVAGRSGTQPRNLTGETIPNGSLLRPDHDHPGGVKRAADWQDGPIVGRVFADYPIGGSGEYELWEPC